MSEYSGATRRVVAVPHHQAAPLHERTIRQSATVTATTSASEEEP